MSREGRTLSTLVHHSLATHYERVRGRVRALVEPLSTEQLWWRPFPYGNSVGHLLLHLTGNLNYYVGAQIARTGYVRDRPREFNDTSHRPTAEVLADFERAVDMVLATLAVQGEADWQAPYQGVGADDAADRLTILVRCAAHADHHAGQMIYLCKQIALKGE
jgi:DinB family protein